MVSDTKLGVALVCVVLFNSVMMGIITYKGAEYRNTLRARTEGLRAAGAVLSGLAPPAPLGKSLGALMEAVAADFVLGAANGSIPAFLQNTLTTNFAGIAQQASGWASQVIETFGNVSCGAVLCERANQEVQCGGRTQYCGAKGEYIDCQPGVGCLPQYLTSGAAAIKSVADKIARVPAINGTATTPPAFSNGIFRVDVVFAWLSAQFDFQTWTSAAQVASNFVANVRRVDFSGCVRDRTDERTRCYDLNSAVTTILNSINQISSVIAQATPSPIGPGPTQAPNETTPAPTTTVAPVTASPNETTRVPTAIPVTASPNETTRGPTAIPVTASPNETTRVPTVSPSGPGSQAPATVSPSGPGSQAPATVSPSGPGSQAPATASPRPGSQAPAITSTPSTEVPTAPLVPQTFSVTVEPGKTTTEVVAAIAAALAIPVSSIQVESESADAIHFSFSAGDAAALSAELNSLAATPQGRADLGIATIQSAPSDSFTPDSDSGNEALYVGLGAGAGGLVLGALVGIVVYRMRSKRTGTEEIVGLSEMDLQEPVN